MPSEIAVPFRVDRDGRIVTTSNQDAQARLHVLALVNTNPLERAAVPGYGVTLGDLLFEGMDPEAVSSSAEVLLTTAFATWEPGIQINQVTGEENSPGDGVAVVNVDYSRRDASDTDVAVANANVAIIGANGVVREVVRG